jgi:hypothetical protein
VCLRGSGSRLQMAGEGVRGVRSPPGWPRSACGGRSLRPAPSRRRCMSSGCARSWHQMPRHWRRCCLAASMVSSASHAVANASPLTPRPGGVTLRRRSRLSDVIEGGATSVSSSCLVGGRLIRLAPRGGAYPESRSENRPETWRWSWSGWRDLNPRLLRPEHHGVCLAGRAPPQEGSYCGRAGGRSSAQMQPMRRVSRHLVSSSVSNRPEAVIPNLSLCRCVLACRKRAAAGLPESCCGGVQVDVA